MTYTEVTAGCTVQSAVYAEYLAKEQSKDLAATNKLGAKNRSQSQGTVPVMRGRPVLDQLGVEATTKPSSTTNTIPNPFASQRKRPASAIETPLASNSSVVSMSETTSPAPPSVIHRDKRPRSDFHVLDLDGSHDAIAAPSHRAGASRPLSPISKELISPKSLSEPLPDMETDLENRGVVWNKFFGPDSIRSPITGPFQLQMSLCIPMQHLSSGERVASLNQTLHSVQITYSPQTRELVLGFVPKSGPSEWSSRTEILTIWTDVKEWATAVHEGVPAYLDSFVTRAISDRCHVDTSDGDPMMKAYQSILNSRYTPKKCLETIELQQSNKIVFQELLTGSFDDIRRKLGSWVFEFNGSKFTAADIATEEWLDYCEVQHRQAVREWSKTAKEFVRCMDENKA